MRRCSNPPKPFVIVYEEPDQLSGLLPADTRLNASIVTTTADHPPRLGQRLESAPGGATEVVHLIVDGPRSAFEVVAAGLVRHEPDATVAVASPGHAPPPWWALDVLAAHGTTVGVDLRRVNWRTANSLWWTTCAGPREVPLGVESPQNAAHAACVLLGASDLDEGSPIAAWLRAVAHEPGGGDSATWDLVLSAQYVAATVEHVAAPEERDTTSLYQCVT